MHIGLFKDKLAKIMFGEKTNREKACPFRGLFNTVTNLCIALYCINNNNNNFIDPYT